MHQTSCTRRCRACRAFTLIELLVVIAILVVIAGMMVAAIGALGIGSKKARTATILETVRQAIEVTAAQTGSSLSPTEHPLAGSFGGPQKPRMRFVRAAAPHPALATVVTVLGGANEAVALRGVGLDHLPPVAQPRLLLDDDVYADDQVPLLFGMRRSQLFVLGGKQAEVTRYRRLPAPPMTTPPTVIANPDDLTLYPTATNLVTSDSGPEANQRTLHYVLGSTNALSELAKLGSLSTPADDLGEHLIAYGRAWSKIGRGDVGEPRWKAGKLNDPERTDAKKAMWKPYRLRGLAVLDAWGVEILSSVSASGAWRLQSAGADGVFRWHPGPDGVYATDPWADMPAGDDRDGLRDNVVSTIGE